MAAQNEYSFITMDFNNDNVAVENTSSSPTNPDHKGRKRALEDTDASQTIAKKPLVEQEDNALNHSTVNLCKDLLNNPGDETILNFSLLSSRDVAGLNSTFAEKEEHSIRADQDHNYILDEELLLLRTEKASMLLELKKKESIINDLHNEIDLLKIEQAECSEKILESEKKSVELQSSLDCALVRANSLEDMNAKLLRDNKLFCGSIKKLTAMKNVSGSLPVKGKGESNSEVEERCKKLGQKVTELETQISETSAANEQKLKKANDDLNTKIKELKNKETALKRVEKSVRGLTDKLNASEKKVTELENSNSRLRLLNDQNKEISVRREEQDSNKKGRERSPRVSHSRSNKSPSARRTSPLSRSRHSSPHTRCSREASSNPKRCAMDNVGRCKRGSGCRDIHASKTCQLYSMFNVCQNVSSCEFRHPTGTCYEWQQLGTCNSGDSCRFKHPVEWRPAYQEAFLDQRPPSYNANPPTKEQASQWPRYSHHDLQGSRW